MEFEIGYLLALLVVGMGVLGIILALAINEINRSKFIISLILSIIILALGGYYYHLVGLYQSKAGKTTGPLNQALLRICRPKLARPIPEKEVVLPEPNVPAIDIIVNVEGKNIFLKDQEHLKIKKGKKLKIVDGILPGVEKNLIRVNLVGFIGNPKLEGEDRGCEIDTSLLVKRYAVNKEGTCYKIEMLKGKEVVITAYVDLIE